MPDEHDGLTEPENDLSDVARGVLRGRLSRSQPLPPSDAEPAPRPEPDLAQMLRDATPDELRTMIVSPGHFTASGVGLEEAGHTWDNIIREIRGAVTAVEGEGAWQAFLAREAAAEHEAAVVEAIKHGFLQSLEAGPPTGQSALDFIDAEPQGATGDERETPSKFDPAPLRSLWHFPRLVGLIAGGLAIFAVGYLIFGGGEDSGDAANGSDLASATPGATDVSTAAPAATAQPTLTAVDLPDLVICPDGSSFSGFEQPDGSYLDATSGEARACPATSN